MSSKPNDQSKQWNSHFTPEWKRRDPIEREVDSVRYYQGVEDGIRKALELIEDDDPYVADQYRDRFEVLIQQEVGTNDE